MMPSQKNLRGKLHGRWRNGYEEWPQFYSALVEIFDKSNTDDFYG